MNPTPVVRITADASCLPGAQRSSPLKLSGDEFRRVGYALVDLIAEHIETLPGRPLTTAASPAELHELLGGEAPLPAQGQDADSLVRSAAALLFKHSLFNGHPRFLGYITSSPSPIGMLGDLLAAAVNANVGSSRLAPIATEIELQAVRWIAELLGYPPSSAGLMVSGGNMANMVALWAARTDALNKSPRSERGADARAGKLRVYASAETHTWIKKAVDLAGLGADAIRWIPVDAEQRLNIAALREAVLHDVRGRDIPMMVVGTAGTVSTGAVDPLDEIGELCRDVGAWFHVDGAYGAFAAALPGAAPSLKALALADSVAVDPHKWLYSPLEAGCVLVRDAAKLTHTFSHHVSYYHFDRAATNFVDLGPQNSRGFRALKVWLGLRQAGRDGIVQMIGEDIALAQRLYAKVGENPELEAMTQSLSITTFRYVPAELRSGVGTDAVDARLNELNERLLERVQVSGEAFVSNAVIGGRYALRACVVNFNTTAFDMDAIPSIVVRLGREVYHAMKR